MGVKIKKIEFLNDKQDVYDLETEDKTFNVLGIIVHNSAICRGFGSTPEKIYRIGIDPVNPYHLNCRSSTVGALDERFSALEENMKRSARDKNGKVIAVSTNMSYYEWLKTQPEKFQDSVIGKTQGKLLRNGGLSVKRFSELNLDKFGTPRKTIFRNGKALTPLEQMREIEPLAFDKIE